MTRDQFEFREVTLPEGTAGGLFLAAMPGRYRPLGRDLDEMRARSIGLVACLTPRHETSLKSPGYADMLTAAALPAATLEYPIEDLDVPERDDGFLRFIAEIAGHIEAGGRVLVHCAGGIGRTATVAACVVAALGHDAEAAMEAVRRAGSFPQNLRQTNLVRWFAEARSFPKQWLP